MTICVIQGKAVHCEFCVQYIGHVTDEREKSYSAEWYKAATGYKHIKLPKNTTRLVQRGIARLRLGYPTYEEIANKPQICFYCKEPVPNAVVHYLGECPITKLWEHTSSKALLAAVIFRNATRDLPALLSHIKEYPPP